MSVFKKHGKTAGDRKNGGIIRLSSRKIEYPEESHWYHYYDEHEMLKGCRFDEVRLHTIVKIDFLRSVVYPAMLNIEME